MGRSLALILAVLCLLVLVPACLAADAAGPMLAVRGTVTLPSGAPVARARVNAVARSTDGATLGSGRGFNAVSDDSGRFTLEFPLPERARLARLGYQLNLWVVARGMHFVALDGQSSLGLDLQLETLPDGASRVVGAANDPRLAALAARAVATGARVEMNGAVFTAVMGELSHEPGMPSRPEIAHVAVSGMTNVASSPPPTVNPTHAAPSSPPPLATTSRPAAPSRSSTVASRESSGTSHPDSHASNPIPSPPHEAMRIVAAPSSAADSFRIERPAETATVPSQPMTPAHRHVAPVPVTRHATKRTRHAPPPPSPITAAVVTRETAPPPPARAPADSGACDCRVAGSVEATAGDPLTEPLRVAVWIEGMPAIADTVTLDMGAPRGFDLPHVPCGERRLAVRVFSERLRFSVRDPAHTLVVHCEPGHRPQTRIELVTR